VTVKFESHARKDTIRLPEADRKAILKAIYAFANGNLENADIKKLKGRNPPEYRLRIGDWRIIFSQNSDILIVRRIVDRKEAYR
jgi:mRNA interferase RelE/StbE